MKYRLLIKWNIILGGLLLYAMSVSAVAAPLDDVSLQLKGDVIQATITLTTPVHFLRFVPSEKSRIVEIYYERVPSSDPNEIWVDQEVRNSPATSVSPAFTVTTRDQATQPKLVVEFSKEVNFSVNAGTDSRSFVITIKPDKVALPTINNLHMPELPTVKAPTSPQTPPLVGSDEANQADNNLQAYNLMLAGRDALSDKNYPLATETFNKLLLLPPNNYSQDAQEWVGVARERGGQLAKAKVEYELYLKLYTSGEPVKFVQQRLARLGSTETIVKNDVPERKTETRSIVQGGISSRYYFGQSNLQSTYQFNNTSQTDNYSLKDQSSLITNVDIVARKVSESLDNRLVYREVETQNFLPGQSNRNRVYAAYFESKNRLTESSIRIGRQTTGGGGVMGRFDGLYAGLGSAQDLRINGVAGQLVDFTSNIQPVFIGTSVDRGPVSVYVINQTIEGILDRRAIGADYKYFAEKRSAYALFDYDIYYNMVNTLMFTGTYGLENGTTFNFMADYRKNLSTRNALNGASTNSVQDMLTIMSEEQLRQLALDRTVSSAYSQIGVTQRINKTWQIGGDFKLAKTSGMPASGNFVDSANSATICTGWAQPVATCTTSVAGYLSATPETGLEKTITAQLIASNLFSKADLTTLGTSYILSDYIQNGESIFIYNRISFNREFSLDSSWNFYHQTDNYGGSLSRHIPMIHGAYQMKRDLSLDADVGYELTTTTGPYQTSINRRIFSSLGFRWNF